MSITHAQAVASLHVVVAVARADGALHPEERRAIEAAIDEAELGDIVNAKQLFDDDFDLAEQLPLLSTKEARDEAFRSAYSLAFADGDCSEAERALLDALREKLDIPAERRDELARVFATLVDKPVEAKSPLGYVADPAERTAAVIRETRKCAMLSALLGAFPVPGLAIVTDLAVIALQVNLVRDLAALHGQELGKRAARSLLAGVGVTGARLAVSNLVKFLPGWGSVIGATSSFAASYAVGRVFAAHFAAGGGATLSEDTKNLRAAFKAGQAEGKQEYAASKAEIEAKQRDTKAEVERLSQEVKNGNLSDEELVDRVSKLP